MPSLETLRAATKRMNEGRESARSSEAEWRQEIVALYKSTGPSSSFATIADAAGVTRQRVWQIVQEQEG